MSACGNEMALGEFYEWLCQDVDVVRAADISAVAPLESGTMGALEIVNVVLSNATALASLAVAYASWRRARNDASPFKLSGDGVTIIVTDGGDAEVQHIIKAFGQRPAGKADHHG